MGNYAKRSDSLIRVVAEWKLPGSDEFELAVQCLDFDENKRLPEALIFEGRVYGYTGWNSDSGRAYYRTGVKLAEGVKR